MPTLRSTTLPLVLLALNLYAQERAAFARDGTAEAYVKVTYASIADSVDFAEFQERHLSNGGSYTILSRSKGYRMVWHMRVEGSDRTIGRGDGRTLKDFQDGLPAGTSTDFVQTMGYGTQCVVVELRLGRRSKQRDLWYFEAP